MYPDEAKASPFTCGSGAIIYRSAVTINEALPTSGT